MGTKKPTIKHECAATGCKAMIRRGLLMCAPHWRMVPLGEQRAIYRTWRAFQRNEDGSKEAYRAAVQAAVDAVAKLEENL